MNASAHKPPPLSPTTRWSLIIAAADDDGNPERAREALDELCRMYWLPMLRFILRKGYSLEDAQDLVQDFFVRLSDPTFFQKADPEKGRFRSLVFASLKHHLLDAADRLLTIKRGGRREIVRLEDWMESERPDEAGCHTTAALADSLFDYEWAALVVRKAMQRLEGDFTSRSKTREFSVIRNFLGGAENACAYAEAASTLNLPVGTIRTLIHRARANYGALLREEVAHTLADLRDLDDEVRHLCRILASRHELLGTAPG